MHIRRSQSSNRFIPRSFDVRENKKFVKWDGVNKKKEDADMKKFILYVDHAYQESCSNTDPNLIKGNLLREMNPSCNL